VEMGIPRDCAKVSEMIEGGRTLQGEFLNDITRTFDGDPTHCAFLWTRRDGPMPLAFASNRNHYIYHGNYLRDYTAFGLRADLMLKEAMTTASYEDWQVLIDRYPGHVLEVSIWNDCVGDLPGRNHICWEIRRY